MPAESNQLIFANSEKARDNITAAQKKEITRLYQQWADDIGERAKYYANKNTSSSPLSERQMKELQKQLKETSHQVSNAVYNGIKQSIYTVSDAVVKDSVDWLKEFGFPEDVLNAAFNSVPDQIVQMLVTGQIYDGGWNLSSRIWGDNEKVLSNCYEIVAKGMAENRTIYDIARELEKYVSPGASKPWNPLLRTKNTQTGEWEYKRIYRGKVDYNAQRLARTLIQHGYQQSFIAVTEKNPFVLKYQWWSNGSRVCPICQDRDGEIYEKGNLPMDHPNGMCTMVPVIDDEMENKLADWFNSEEGTYPDIDEFAKSFGYAPPKMPEKKMDIKSLDTSKGKAFNGWYGKLTPEQKALAKSLKEESGLTWQKWYERNIYTGKPLEEQKQQVVAVVFDKPKWQAMFDSQTTAHMLSTEQEAFDKMTEKQIQAIKVYTGSAYREINGYLRNIAKGMSEKDAIDDSMINSYKRKAIGLISEGLEKASTKEDYVLYRGTSISELAGFLPGDFNKNRKELEKMSAGELENRFVGSVGTYAGFTSTCSVNDKGQWSGSVFRGERGSLEMAIYAPKGTPATSIMGVSDYGASEGEFLLNKGTSIYIHGIEETKEGVIRVWAEILN